MEKIYYNERSFDNDKRSFQEVASRARAPLVLAGLGDGGVDVERVVSNLNSCLLGPFDLQRANFFANGLHKLGRTVLTFERLSMPDEKEVVMGTVLGKEFTQSIGEMRAALETIKDTYLAGLKRLSEFMDTHEPDSWTVYELLTWETDNQR